MFSLIIRGPLASGKSTVAKKIAKELNAVYISIDEVLADHNLDKVSEHEGCIPAANFIEANEYAIKLLVPGKATVIDGNFYYQEQIEDLISKLEGRHYIFDLKASVETCIARDKERGETHGKWAAIAVHNMVSKFSYGESIDTENKTSTEIVSEIIEKINE